MRAECKLQLYLLSSDVTTLPLSGVDKPIPNGVDFSQAAVYKALKNSKVLCRVVPAIFRLSFGLN